MQYSLDNQVLEIHFDDPQSNNAFDLKKAQSLVKILETKDLSLIIFKSSGRVFCSGGNLKEYSKLKTKSQGLEVNQAIRLVLQKLAQHSALKVAFVSGDCFGGGIELISACNLIYCAPHVFFGMWQRKMSLSFGWGGFERLSQRMSADVLQEWLLTSEIKTAFWALEQGLVDEVMSVKEMSYKEADLKTKCLRDEDKTFHEVVLSLKKNEVGLFEKLWGSKHHLAKLKKFTE